MYNVCLCVNVYVCVCVRLGGCVCVQREELLCLIWIGKYTSTRSLINMLPEQTWMLHTKDLEIIHAYPQILETSNTTQYNEV